MQASLARLFTAKNAQGLTDARDVEHERLHLFSIDLNRKALFERNRDLLRTMKLDLLPLGVTTVFRKGERKASLSQGHRRTGDADVKKAVLSIGLGANREASPVGSADLDGKQMHVDGLGRQIVEAHCCSMDIEMMEQLIDSACKIQLSACFTCTLATFDRIERDCGIKTKRQRFAEVLSVAYTYIEHCGLGLG